jgi:hypothetical protein
MGTASDAKKNIEGKRKAEKEQAEKSRAISEKAAGGAGRSGTSYRIDRDEKIAGVRIGDLKLKSGRPASSIAKAVTRARQSVGRGWEKLTEDADGGHIGDNTKNEYGKRTGFGGNESSCTLQLHWLRRMSKVRLEEVKEALAAQLA